jgi:hypothetical protein
MVRAHGPGGGAPNLDRRPGPRADATDLGVGRPGAAAPGPRHAVLGHLGVDPPETNFAAAKFVAGGGGPSPRVRRGSAGSAVVSGSREGQVPIGDAAGFNGCIRHGGSHGSSDES